MVERKLSHSEQKTSHVVHRNLTSQELHAFAVTRGEGRETRDGVVTVETFPTGRSPEGNGVVANTYASELGINFGKINGSVSEEDFEDLRQRAEARLGEDDEFVLDGYVRSGVDRVIPVTFRSPTAWTTLFMHNLLVRQEQVDTFSFSVETERSFEILHVPDVEANITVGEKQQSVAVVTQFNPDGRHIVVVANTEYAGENKKKVFGGLNALLPQEGILPVHASATADPVTGDVTVFEGLSGTGKTTLSTDPKRRLIGDDEHGIAFKHSGETGIFNFEGGSYAKTIGLTEAHEPDIYHASKRPGTVLENVALDPEGSPIYEEGIDNQRAAYPIDAISFADPKGVGKVPNRLVLLNAELGVLPPVAKLTKEQALHAGYEGFTMKMPGTEKGIIEPTPTYSAFFGHVFLTLREVEYGKLYEEYIDQKNPEIYAVGTGFIGGNTKNRRGIGPTRAIIDAINAGALSTISWKQDRLGRYVPAEPILGVPEEFLDPLSGWESEEAYREAAQKLIFASEQHMEKFRGQVPDAILSAGIKLRES